MNQKIGCLTQANRIPSMAGIYSLTQVHGSYLVLSIEEIGELVNTSTIITYL